MRADDVYAILSKRIKEMQAPGGGELDWELLSKKLGTPVGEIISYMGTAAPEHYLICDGAEYNVEEYPELVQHFIDNFGSANYFGGDGETTFAVPDLRGEFLRGTGTATRDTGSGVEVGGHQNATAIPVFAINSNNGAINCNYRKTDKENYVNLTNVDKILDTRTATSINSSTNVIPIQSTTPSVVSTRPTNTSVLYCIKY